jgi:hypothetical protein
VDPLVSVEESSFWTKRKMKRAQAMPMENPTTVMTEVSLFLRMLRSAVTM